MRGSFWRSAARRWGLRVTGIPATEAQALRSTGEAYRRYQQTTSPFIPWFPRKVEP